MEDSPPNGIELAPFDLAACTQPHRPEFRGHDSSNDVVLGHLSATWSPLVLRSLALKSDSSLGFFCGFCRKRAFIIQLCTMYWFTGWAKMNPTWLKGEAIHNVLNLNIVCRPLGKYLLEYPDLLGTMCHVTLWMEFGAPFLLFIPWKTAWIRTGLVTIFFGFHLGIVLTMTVGLVFGHLDHLLVGVTPVGVLGLKMVTKDNRVDGTTSRKGPRVFDTRDGPSHRSRVGSVL